MRLLRCVCAVALVCPPVMRLPCPSFRSSSQLCWRADGGGSGSVRGSSETNGESGSDTWADDRWEEERAAAVGIPSVMGSASHRTDSHSTAAWIHSAAPTAVSLSCPSRLLCCWCMRGVCLYVSVRAVYAGERFRAAVSVSCNVEAGVAQMAVKVECSAASTQRRREAAEWKRDGLNKQP